MSSSPIPSSLRYLGGNVRTSSWCWVLVLTLFVAGCTKPNPAAVCTGEGMCIDPAYPFCDLKGTFGGDPGACIAITCHPGEVASCVGNEALTCDAMGGGYDAITCALGCKQDGTRCFEISPLNALATYFDLASPEQDLNLM